MTYSSNGQSNLIVFGKDTSGNVLITTELPIDNAFTLHGGAEAWIKYESDTDSTYGLNKAYSTYGETIQGTQVYSKSIKMEDINYVAGLTPKTVTEGGNTYKIQSFDTYTFGIDTYNATNKTANYWYPVESGGTLASGEGSGYWQKPTAGKEKPFQNDWYGYYCDWNSGECSYWGVETNANPISASTVGLNTDRLKYIWGGNTQETYYNEYLVASRSVDVSSDRAYFDVGSYGVRPVVELPSGLIVEEVETGKYDLAH